MTSRYNDWSSHDLEHMLMLDRKEGFVDEELAEEFDRRCAEALAEVFEEICGRYPNVIHPRERRKETPSGCAEG